MKIAYLIDDGLDNPDGVQQYIMTLGRWMQSRGHEIYYIAGETKKSPVKNIYCLSKNITVNFNGNKLRTPLPVSRKKINYLHEAHKFDIIHLQTPHSPFYAARIIKNARSSTAVISTFHILPYGIAQRSLLKLWAIAMRKNFKCIDVSLAVSEPAADLASKLLGKKTRIIPNAVYPYWQASSKTSNRKDIKIVFLGRLVKRKGCQQLVQAIKFIEDHKLITQKYRVIIGGDGPKKNKTKSEIDKNGLSHKIKMAGFVDQGKKYQLLSDADIAVFPSLSGESFGIVIIEAMSAGSKVVLGGDNPGYRSVLENNSFLFDPNNIEQFAVTIAKYANNRRERDKANKVQVKTFQNYNIENVGPKIEKIYQESCKKLSK